MTLIKKAAICADIPHALHSIGTSRTQLHSQPAAILRDLGAVLETIPYFA